MTRCIFSLTLLLGCILQAKAEFVLIKLDLDKIDLDGLKTTDGQGKPAWIYGVFEYQESQRPKMAYPGVVFVNKFGPEIVFPVFAESRTPTVQSLAAQFRKKIAAKDAQNPDVILRRAIWALEHRMHKEFILTMKELGTLDKERPAFQRCVKVSDYLEKKEEIPPDDIMMSTGLRAELKGYKTRGLQNFHYTIFFKEASEAQTKSRLQYLEIAFRDFLWWFALQENLPMPVLPDRRLPVLLESPTDFAKRHKEWGQSNEETAGFTVRGDNLIVLCNGPNSDFLQTLEKNLGNTLRANKFNPGELLSGDIWTKPNSWLMNPKGVKIPKPNVSLAQALLLLQKKMEDDVELSAVTREGARQLLGATGFLSRNVAIPEWAHGGLASYFEVPPAHLHVGFGTARGDYLPVFKEMVNDGKIKSKEVLTNLARDHYFRQGQRGAGLKRKRELGRATAWSLVYYLANNGKLEYLANYADLLNTMPRHTPLHPDSLATCFTRSFREFEPDGWFDWMANQPVESSDVDSFFGLAR